MPAGSPFMRASRGALMSFSFRKFHSITRACALQLSTVKKWTSNSQSSLLLKALSQKTASSQPSLRSKRIVRHNSAAWAPRWRRKSARKPERKLAPLSSAICNAAAAPPTWTAPYAPSSAPPPSNSSPTLASASFWEDVNYPCRVLRYPTIVIRRTAGVKFRLTPGCAPDPTVLAPRPTFPLRSKPEARRLMRRPHVSFRTRFFIASTSASREHKQRRQH